jgi:hypothetical protein
LNTHYNILVSAITNTLQYSGICNYILQYTGICNYIHFTKYGGVNKGEVEHYGSTMNYDYENEVVYVSHYIRSTVGHAISTDGSDGRVYKITENMDPEMLKKLKSSLGVLDELKNRKEKFTKEKFAHQSKVQRTKEMIAKSNIEEALKEYDKRPVEPLDEKTIKKINKQAIYVM